MDKQMKLLITTDDPVSDVKMALAKEHHNRAKQVEKLILAGHVSVVEDDNPAFIRVRIEDEFFQDERSRFPSTTMIARLQLAIQAGRSDRNRIVHEQIADHAAADSMHYTLGKYGRSNWHAGWLKEQTIAMGYDNAGDYVTLWDKADGVTAAVKAAPTKALRKGLRP